MGSAYKGRHRVNWLFLSFLGLLSATLEGVTIYSDFLASAVPKLLLVVTRRQKRASLYRETQPRAAQHWLLCTRISGKTGCVRIFKLQKCDRHIYDSVFVEWVPELCRCFWMYN